MSIVNNTNDSGTGSLRQAIIDSNINGTTINVNTTGTVVLLSALPTLTNAWWLFATPGTFTIDSSGVSNATLVSSGDHLIYGVDFDNGNSATGYFFHANATASFIIQFCTFSNNNLTSTTHALGKLDVETSLIMLDCDVTDVSFTGTHRRALTNDNTTTLTVPVVIERCTFTNVGDILLEHAELLISECTWDNSAWGGNPSSAIVLLLGATALAGTVTNIVDNVFNGVTAQSGAVRVDGYCGDVTITGNQFLTCDSTGPTTHPGALWIASVKEGDIEISGNIFDTCTGVANVGATLISTDTTNTPTSIRIENNSWESCGGGLDAGALSINTCKLTSGNIEVVNNTFDSNSSTRWGGAIRQVTGASNAAVDYCNNTFRNNSCGTALSGGAIRIENNVANMYNNIMWGNTANAVGNDIQKTGGTLNTENSLIESGGTGAPSDGVDGNKVGGSYNPHISAISTSNGGTVGTCKISNESDAVDGGSLTHANSLGLTTDARGFKRVMGGQGLPDMGAFEVRRFASIVV